jgi:hypothetical protein
VLFHLTTVVTRKLSGPVALWCSMQGRRILQASPAIESRLGKGYCLSCPQPFGGVTSYDVRPSVLYGQQQSAATLLIEDRRSVGI